MTVLVLADLEPSVRTVERLFFKDSARHDGLDSDGLDFCSPQIQIVAVVSRMMLAVRMARADRVICEDCELKCLSWVGLV